MGSIPTASANAAADFMDAECDEAFKKVMLHWSGIGAYKEAFYIRLHIAMIILVFCLWLHFFTIINGVSYPSIAILTATLITYFYVSVMYVSSLRIDAPFRKIFYRFIPISFYILFGYFVIIFQFMYYNRQFSAELLSQ